MSITLVKSDCLEYMKTLPDASVDCFICDLPYGCLSGGGTLQNPKSSSYGQNACAWDIKLNLDAFWTQIKRLRKNDNTPCLMFCTTKFGNELINSNPKEFRYDLVWDKQHGVSFLTANKMPMRSHEMIYVFSKSGAYYNRVDVKGDFKAVAGGCKPGNVYGNIIPTNNKPNNAGRRCALSVLNIGNFGRKGNHPTEKPMELYKFLIERYCPPGGTILDPTAGSFNSCFAGMELDRNAIGIEKDEGFYNKACKRVDEM